VNKNPAYSKMSDVGCMNDFFKPIVDICMLCGEDFQFFMQARDHVLKLHTRCHPKFKCDKCGVNFHKETSLTEHTCQDEIDRHNKRGHIMVRDNKENKGDKDLLLKQGTVMVIAANTNGEDDEDEDVHIDF